MCLCCRAKAYGQQLLWCYIHGDTIMSLRVGIYNMFNHNMTSPSAEPHVNSNWW